MNLCVDVQVASEDDDHPPPLAIEQWAAAAIKGHKEDAELTIRIVDNAEITALNHQYRGKDSATNVLSFPADLPAAVELPLLGDLIICASVVNSEAREQHKADADHWAHMVIHGCLHLLGYDHIEDADADIMEGLEIDILAGLAIANPYISTHHALHTSQNSLRSKHPKS
ncbi:MAG: putative rRNA maturation factor [Oceanicoccus sp.]|jgi:probable rRNA maturation factor